jgi:hypothetical protein
MPSKCGQMKGGRRRGSRRQRGRQQRGGTGNAPSSGAYSDAASFVESQVGNGNQQWENVFVRGGMNGNQVQSLDGSQPSSVLSTNLSNLPPMTGGRRRGRGRTQRRSRKQRGGRTMRRQRGQTRSKKGGFFGAVLEQALVPFGLFAAQNRYAKRTRNNRK